MERILQGDRLERLPDLARRNRLQPAVGIKSVLPDLTKSGTVNVTISVKNFREAGKASGARDLKLFREGKLVAVRDLKPGMEEQSVQNPGIRLPVNSGQRLEFSAYAFNTDLVKSQTHRVQYSLPAPAPATRGRAWVFTIGVNETPKAPDLTLLYAANDAQLLGDELGSRLRQTGEWTGVTVRVLNSALSTPKAAIREEFLALQEAVRPEDLVVIGFSGHGFTDSKGAFFLIPADILTASGKPSTATAISTDELTEWIRPIDAGQMLFLVDACQSAATVNGRGLKPSPMGASGLGQLAYDKRMLVLAAGASPTESR